LKKLNVFLAGVVFCAAAGAWAAEADKGPATQAAAEEENLTAAQILTACTKVIPTDRLLLKGTLTVRKQRGIVLAEFPYKLMLDWGAKTPCAECLLLDDAGTSLVQRAVMIRPVDKPAQIRLYSGPEQKPEESPIYSGRIRGTDMTWMDLTLDFLWWKDVRFDDTPRGECRLGRDCDILVVVPPGPLPGCSAVRLWIDRQWHCLMQVEQLDPQGEPVRRMWVQRVKKVEDRWMIPEMEIETLNSGHRTRLFVDEVASP
jgi:hypothetical protein